MSALTVYADDNPAKPLRHTTLQAEIMAVLADIGVQFEQWDASQPVQPGDPQDKVLQAYASDVERIMSEGGYVTADVISLAPDNPNRDAIRAKFLSEHTHSEDEVRFFVAGSGMFYLHIQGRVYQILCEKGDFLSVPAMTTHWFDTSAAPEVTAIRIFTDPAGWVAEYTGDDIASRFPKYERT